MSVPPQGIGPGGVAPAGGWVLATWGQRALAALVDGLILLGLAAVITVPVSVAMLPLDDALEAVAYVMLLLISLTVASLLYQPVWMARTNGQTIGKQVMGIRVVRTDGRPVGFGFALLREALVKNLLVGTLAAATGGIAYLVDLLWPLWDEERRALHDFVVRTRVVRA